MYGYLERWFGQSRLMVTALSIHLILIITMLAWKAISTTLPVLFIVAGLWGTGNAFIHTGTMGKLKSITCLYTTDIMK